MSTSPYLSININITTMITNVMIIIRYMVGINDSQLRWNFGNVARPRDLLLKPVRLLIPVQPL